MQSTKINVAPQGAGAAGAGPANQQAPCRYVKLWVDNYRSDVYVAVALDKFVEMVNGYLSTIGEGLKITKEDVKMCLRYDDTVKIVDVNGKEVLWLWNGWRLYDMINKAVEAAAKEGEASIVAGI